MKPLVSICIPTFNGETYIAEAMESVLQQDYSNLEIIVSDDSSQDDTLSVVERYKTKTQIPIQLHHHTPKGIGANWNHCIEKANGEYIKFLFQDDRLEPQCVSKMMAMMGSADTIGMVYAKRHIISDSNDDFYKEFKRVYGQLHTNWGELSIKTGSMPGQAYLKDSQFLNAPKNKIGEPSSVLIKKKCFKKVGLFNTDLKQALDCEFWYRLMPFYDIGFVDEYLGTFRLHKAQASHKNKQAKINETEQLYKMYYKTLLPHLHKKCKWKLHKRFHPLLSRLVKVKNG
ncbi:glycosyltransferase family 2 protein [Winogradskyella sp. A3E31]|uniref:glycosyltransferase family 2 protein n=1 Tax=Winogradskyella sp. A3E31 TaxID=3349637 RepID=UPI00398B4C08